MSLAMGSPTNVSMSFNATHITGQNFNLISAQRFSLSSDTANNLGYGIGRIIRGTLDSFWETWQKTWTPHPSAGKIAEQRNYMIYEAGLKECVRLLGPALANLERNPMDRGALNKVRKLAEHFVSYLKPSHEGNLRELQSKILKPLEERISAVAYLDTKNALSKWMPVFFQQLYTNNLKNREFDKEGPQNCCSERATIVDRQGASENKNYEINPTQSKTDSSSCLCIKHSENLESTISGGQSYAYSLLDVCLSSFYSLVSKIDSFSLIPGAQASSIELDSENSVEQQSTALRETPVSKELSKDERYEHVFVSAWQRMLEKLKEESPIAVKWLEICAHLNSDDIPQEWLADWLDKQDGGSDSFPELENERKIIKVLLELSLIRSGKEGYTMNRLSLQEVRRSRTSEKAFSEALELVNSHCKEGGDNLEQWKTCATQANAIENSQFFQNVNPRSQAKILYGLGINLFSLREYQEAIKQLKRVLEIWEETPPSDDRIRVMGHQFVGKSLEFLERHQESLEYFEKALEIAKKTLSPNDSGMAASHHFVGASLLNLGRHQESLEHFEKVLEISEKTLLPNDPKVAVARIFLGTSLQSLERNQEALGQFEKALEILEKTAPSINPIVAACHDQMGVSLQFLGRPQEALEHFKKALEIWEKTMPPRQVLTFMETTLKNLASQKNSSNYKFYQSQYFRILGKQTEANLRAS
jgi:tetratricopeptide (TPR) repeat protein